MFSRERLQDYITLHAIQLLDDNRNNTDISFYRDVKRESTIYFKCIHPSCTTFHSKTYRRLIDTGAFCQQHTQKNRMEKIKEKCLKETGYENQLSNPDIQSKIKQTNLEKYGTEHPMQNKEVTEKMSNTIKRKNINDAFRKEKINDKKKETYQKTLGVDHPSQSSEIKEKKQITTLQHYGVCYPAQSPMITKKMADTYKSKTGFESVSANPAVRKKAQDTLEKRIGVRHSMQDPEIKRKSFATAFRLKKFKLPSGDIIKCMGFEHFGITYLLENEQINETNIVTEELQSFTYQNPNEDFTRTYTPDIFIKSQNRYIEIKSTWTFSLNTETIFKKQQIVKDKGYNCEIWVFNNKGERVNIFL